MEDGKKKKMIFGVIAVIVVIIIVSLVLSNNSNDEAEKPNGDSSSEETNEENGSEDAESENGESDENGEANGEDAEETAVDFEAIAVALGCEGIDAEEFAGQKRCQIGEGDYSLIPDEGENKQTMKKRLSEVCEGVSEAAILVGSGFFLYNAAEGPEAVVTTIEGYEPVTTLLPDGVSVEL